MSDRPPAHLIRTAADLRADGNAWERVADEVGCTPAEVRMWPQRFPARWQKAFAAAVQRALVEATSETITLLRKQLRSKNDESVREAGMKLVQIRIVLEKAARPPQGDTQPTSSPPGYADRLLALVRGMTDEQIAAEMAAASGG